VKSSIGSDGHAWMQEGNEPPGHPDGDGDGEGDGVGEGPGDGGGASQHNSHPNPSACMHWHPLPLHGGAPGDGV